MSADLTNLVVVASVFGVSLISTKLSMPVVVIEIICGAVMSFFGLVPQEWMMFFAALGGVVITFLAGAEMDTKMFREKFRQSFLIGFLSFFVPFIAISLYTYFYAGWKLNSSLIAGVALSTTSLGVIYSILMETGMHRTELGKLLMSATFVTDISTVLIMSILFVKTNWYTALFYGVSALVIYLAAKYSGKLFGSPLYRNKLAETEMKYVLFLLFIFIYFAELGNGHAVLPAFLLGFFMSKYFTDTMGHKLVNNKIRSSSYAFITPIFFIIGGLKISVPLLISGIGMFLALFLIQISSKFIGVYFVARKHLEAPMYSTLLMSTGLTFGTIASYFGLQSGLIDSQQYSVLVGVVIFSAVVPTIIAQKFFMPVNLLKSHGRG